MSQIKITFSEAVHDGDSLAVLEAQIPMGGRIVSIGYRDGLGSIDIPLEHVGPLIRILGALEGEAGRERAQGVNVNAPSTFPARGLAARLAERDRHA